MTPVAYSWQGTANSNWNNLNNWLPAAIPGAGDTVEIGTGVGGTAPLCELGAAVTVDGLTILNGGRLNVVGNGDLTVDAALNNNTVIVTGNFLIDTGATVNVIGDIIFNTNTTTIIGDLSVGEANINNNAQVIVGDPVTAGNYALEAGILNVNNGRLRMIDGSVTATILSVEENGFLSGYGGIGGDVLSEGSFSVGDATGRSIAVDGNVSTTGVTAFRIDDNTVTNLWASGTITVGGTLSIAQPNGGLDTNSSWTIISADSVEGEFSTVNQPGGFLFSAPTYTPNSVEIQNPDLALPGNQVGNQNIALILSAANANAISIPNPSVDALLELTLSASHGKLTLASTSGLTFSSGTGTNNYSMTFVGTIANINLALDGLSYTPDTNYIGTDSLVVSAADDPASGGPYTTGGAVSIDVEGPVTVAGFTFQSSAPTTAGPYSAEVGSGSVSQVHASGSTVYSNPVGNGNSESFSSNHWQVGDYFLISISTIGFQNLSITWDQAGSATGPRDFDIEYAVGGGSFTSFASYDVALSNWSSTTHHNGFDHSYDLSSVNALENQSTIYIRLICTSTSSINGGTVGTSGTSRIDDLVISGFTI